MGHHKVSKGHLTFPGGRDYYVVRIEILRASEGDLDPVANGQPEQDKLVGRAIRAGIEILDTPQICTICPEDESIGGIPNSIGGGGGKKAHLLCGGIRIVRLHHNFREVQQRVDMG